MRYIITVLILMFSTLIARAEILPHTIYAVTLNHISSENVKVNQTIQLITFDESACNSSNICPTEGDRIDIKILQYVKPKRGKRDGYYKVEYKKSADNIMYGKMRASTPKDMQSIAKKTGIIIAGRILKIPGFSQAIALTKGFINPNENENRIQSAGKNLYESTPLTYIEEGKDFDVEAEGIVVLKLKEKYNGK